MPPAEPLGHEAEAHGVWSTLGRSEFASVGVARLRGEGSRPAVSTCCCFRACPRRFPSGRGSYVTCQLLDPLYHGSLR